MENVQETKHVKWKCLHVNLVGFTPETATCPKLLLTGSLEQLTARRRQNKETLRLLYHLCRQVFLCQAECFFMFGADNPLHAGLLSMVSASTTVWRTIRPHDSQSSRSRTSSSDFHSSETFPQVWVRSTEGNNLSSCRWGYFFPSLSLPWLLWGLWEGGGV